MFKVKNRVGGTVVLLFAALIIGTYIIYPQLNRFTGGVISQRFLDLDTTGRAEISQQQIAIWEQNVIFGVGPGEAAYELERRFGQYAAAHSEYTRLFAEHGIFGFIALLLLVGMSVNAYLLSPGWQSKLYTIIFIAWPIAEMSHAAMRIAAIRFIFGFAMVHWHSKEENQALKI